MNTDPIFEPGDKVVCVDDEMQEEIFVIYRVSKGRVYCVESILIVGRTVGVVISGKCVLWHSPRFRKVCEVGHPAIAISEEVGV